MALNMLSAYYQKGTDSHKLFQGLKIEQDPSFEKHINRYDVICLTMTDFFNRFSSDIREEIKYLEKELILDLKEDYPSVNFDSCRDFIDYFYAFFQQTGRSFVILIDEWDYIIRVFQDNEDKQQYYLDFLRLWLKDKPYVELVYMTGILPIKKMGWYPLNMFHELTITRPWQTAPLFGFTEVEVQDLCQQNGMDFQRCKAIYEGYELHYSDLSYRRKEPKVCKIYNPVSVVYSMINHGFSGYWVQTETYKALQKYIMLEMEGLREKVLYLLAGQRVRADGDLFPNDMTTFYHTDNVLALLVHLGYLSYDRHTEEVFVPNNEILRQFVDSIEDSPDWSHIVRAIHTSEKTLKAVLDGNGEAVAASLESLHDEGSILQYNDEESLACAIRLCFLTAGRLYNVVREMPTGKGFADIALIPRPFCGGPAIVVELKYNETVNTAMDQIKARGYCNKLGDYSVSGKVILVAVNYEKDSTKSDYKKHTCVIETMPV